MFTNDVNKLKFNYIMLHFPSYVVLENMLFSFSSEYKFWKNFVILSKAGTHVHLTAGEPTIERVKPPPLKKKQKNKNIFILCYFFAANRKNALHSIPYFAEDSLKDPASHFGNH